MGWWPSIFGGDKPSDPVSQLDPKLRDFLEKESPVQYRKNQPSQSPSTAPIAVHPPPPPPQNGQDVDGGRPVVPSESLYQDGRYAHLWKNYRPQVEIEAETMTDRDRLMSVLESYQDRKAEISKVAMENCVEAQEEWINCMKHGKWEDQLQMCRHQVRRFEKCYTMQSRFLRALGYGSVEGRSRQVEEDIQMHADALYQRVLKHEAAVEEARKEGKPLPVFDPTVPRLTKSPTVEPSQELQQQWTEKLEQLPESERPAEEAALRADLQNKTDVARSMKEYYESHRKEKPKQPGADKSLGDTLLSLVTGR